MDDITKEIQGEVPWCMLFMDDIVLVGKIGMKLVKDSMCRN